MNINEAMEGLKKAASADPKQIILNSFKEIFSFECNKTFKVFVLLLSCVLSIISVAGNHTKIILEGYLDLLMNINSVMFGLLFTGYSIFQALLSKKLVIILLNAKEKNIDSDERSLLLRNNEYFINVMIVQFICVLLDIVVILVLKCINYINLNVIFKNYNSIKDVIALFLISSIISINLFSLVEVKSSIINLFRIFNLSAYIQAKEHLDEIKCVNDNNV